MLALTENRVVEISEATAQQLKGVRPGINLPSDPIIIGNRACTSGTSGGIKCLSINNPIRSGRISWREVVSK